MTNHPLRRARVLGALLALGAFGLGAAGGITYANRRGSGVVMTLTTTDQIPQELERLGLSDAQRARIRQILRDAQPRVFAILKDVEPRMRAALAATDVEIADVLNAEQRARWEEYRRQHPPRLEERHLTR
jgi:uncharacterized membrane protein